MAKTIVMIPTYNEKENIERLIREILNLKIKNLEIVVVDDNSPDGTWKIVEKIAKKNKKVRLLLRKKDRGRGYAGKAGYKFCLEHGADYIIEMDADFSHDPAYIPKMLDEIKNYDVVLGSRGVKGGSEVGRGIIRRILTKGANFYVRMVLGLNVNDCDSGYRCFRKAILEKIGVDKIASKGPSITQEVLFKTYLKGAKIKEIPIIFKDRKRGASKLGVSHVLAAYFGVLRYKLDSILGRI